MKLVKSLLLGSAAGIAAVAGAQAADLPSRKAAPVEYVRVCTAYGAGFFYIPGTDTCLRIGGRVRAEYTFGERFGSAQDSYGTRARGRINIDARNATAYGTLRTFIRFDLTTSTGSYNYGALNSGANPAVLGRGANSNTASLDKGFIQFGPITAGKAQSFFDFYANDLGFSSVRTADASPNLLAYTATFGGGFSATLSLEDRASARELTARSSTGAAIAYEGQVMPDIVASVNVTQGWGSAQLSGALSQRSILGGSDEWGWAVQGGVKINLPMLAAGDALWLQAAYAEGAIGYLGYGSTFGYGNLGLLNTADYTVNLATGQTKATKGFSIVAGLRHYWLPTLRSEVYGSYSELDFGRVSATQVKLDPKEFIIAGNLIWTPVAGLDIGVEVLYSKVELKNRIVDVTNPLRTVKSDDAVAGRLRIQRDF